MLALFLTGCGGSAGLGGDETSGPEFVRGEPLLASFNEVPASESGVATIDTSGLANGYVGASAVSQTRLKFQVSLNGVDSNYDLPSDGTPIICPINMGDGAYTFTIYENTSENRYATVYGVSENVQMASEFEPFLRPNMFSWYDPSSACVAKANELTAGAANEGDALKSIYNWIVDNIDYDRDKAAALAEATGYVPSPDETLQNGTGICFDYATLAAAMLRSQGIPCKIITGYVSPDNIYHAWNMVYIDGSWVSAYIDVQAQTWTRIDTTFASGGAAEFIGDGTAYTDRYVY